MNEQVPSKDKLAHELYEAIKYTPGKIISIHREFANRILTALRAENEPPAVRGEWGVMRICAAYESGFGHGAAGDGLPNPYAKGSAEFEAYQIGVDAGYAEGKRGAAEPPADQTHHRQQVIGDLIEVYRRLDDVGRPDSARLVSNAIDELRLAGPSQPPAPGRTDADYAIEHAGYLATAAEQFIKSTDEYDKAVDSFEDGTDDGNETLKEAVHSAFEARCDHRNGLANAIYEFRKRAERATSTKGEAQ